MAKYFDIFAECDSNVGTTNLTFHEIDTGDVRPLRQSARHLPYGKNRAIVESEINKLVSADIARASISLWASPVVIVPKKDGGWRLCVDYRSLNSVTKLDCFPLQRLDKALDAFAGASFQQSRPHDGVSSLIRSPSSRRMSRRLLSSRTWVSSRCRRYLSVSVMRRRPISN